MWNQLRKIAQEFEVEAYRGVSDSPADPGDLGVGEYWTTYETMAKSYGDVKKENIKLNNPLFLTKDEAVKLVEEYGTVKGGWYSRKAGAEMLTEDIKNQGYDGLVVDGYETPEGHKTIVVFP